MKEKIIIICGPTCTGKTDVAIRLAKIFNGEIINCDSMQFYRYMDIGTAKVTRKEMNQVKHHLIDIINPDEDFNVADFLSIAKKTISQIVKEGKIPFVVGGSGLYIKVLLHGIFEDTKKDNKILLELENTKVENLYEKLKEVDYDYAKKITKNDKNKIIRALEFCYRENKQFSKAQKEHQFNNNLFDYLKIGIFQDRKGLYEKINKRVDLMIENGFIAEVEKLVQKGFSLENKPMNSIGYKHILKYIKKEYTLDEAISVMKRDTRRYAKRQFTWFNKDSQISWFTIDKIDEMSKLIEETFFADAKDLSKI